MNRVLAPRQGGEIVHERYYFDVSGSGWSPDTEGIELENDAVAQSCASTAIATSQPVVSET